MTPHAMTSSSVRSRDVFTASSDSCRRRGSWVSGVLLRKRRSHTHRQDFFVLQHPARGRLDQQLTAVQVRQRELQPGKSLQQGDLRDTNAAGYGPNSTKVISSGHILRDKQIPAFFPASLPDLSTPLPWPSLPQNSPPSPSASLPPKNQLLLHQPLSPPIKLTSFSISRSAFLRLNTSCSCCCGGGNVRGGSCKGVERHVGRQSRSQSRWRAAVHLEHEDDVSRVGVWALITLIPEHKRQMYARD